VLLAAYRGQERARLRRNDNLAACFLRPLHFVSAAAVAARKPATACLVKRTPFRDRAHIASQFRDSVSDNRIMATCRGASPASSANPDTALLTDIDLAILGAPTARFADHERRIRAEYAWVAPEVFAVKDARCCAVSSSALRSVPCRSCTSACNAWHTTTCAAPRQIANPACQNRINSSQLSLQ